jgi:hypothetical protein
MLPIFFYLRSSERRTERRVRRIKVFGVDVSTKWILFEADGKRYSVYFHDNMIKGVHDVSIHEGTGKKEVKIVSTYPPLKQWLTDVWRIWIPQWFKWKIRKFQQSHNQ